MGIDISGGMIVGANAAEVETAVTVAQDDCEMFGTEGNYYEEFYQWYEGVGMEIYSFYYDADARSQVVGFTVADVEPLSENFDKWVSEVRTMAQDFEDMTGVKASLIGMQNVW